MKRLTEDIRKDLDESNWEKVDSFWDTFDMLTDKQKIRYLLEFECIFDTVRLWGSESLEDEHKLLKERVEK